MEVVEVCAWLWKCVAGEWLSFLLGAAFGIKNTIVTSIVSQQEERKCGVYLHVRSR